MQHTNVTDTLYYRTNLIPKHGGIMITHHSAAQGNLDRGDDAISDAYTAQHHNGCGLRPVQPLGTESGVLSDPKQDFSNTQTL